MRKHVEKTFGKTLRGVFKVINPIKKKVIKTYCLVHKFINNQAVEVLKTDGYIEEYEYFKKYLKFMNEGAVWADQDLKSANHFFHYEKERGLYGFSNALAECEEYYSKARDYLEEDNFEKSMFYLGAACHLIQDSTVPQHINNKLLMHHRKFELWIIDELLNNNAFRNTSNIIYYHEIYDYIRSNAKKAYDVSLEYKKIPDLHEKFHKIATEIILQAQSTTAGVLLKFFNEEVRHI